MAPSGGGSGDAGERDFADECLRAALDQNVSKGHGALDLEVDGLECLEAAMTEGSEGWQSSAPGDARRGAGTMLVRGIVLAQGIAGAWRCAR